MPYEVELTPATIRHLRRLPRHVQQSFREKALALADDTRPYYSKPMKTAPERRIIRIGDYRIFYQVDHSSARVLVLDVIHRKDAYRH